jgi:uncharacterized protein YndB with AHSA1/START domain
LKFFVHFGSFGIQRIAEHDELVGSEVNLLHRLLKNSVAEKVGTGAYVLYTEAAIKRLEAEDLLGSMTPHHESYDHLGRVKVWVQDLRPVWEKRKQEKVVELPKDEVDIELSIDIDVPPERLWDYMMLPEFRNALIGSDRMSIANRSQGRIGSGSVYQCFHGEMLIPQTILAWQPFESVVIRQPFPMAPSATMLGEYRLQPREGGTRLTQTAGKLSGSVRGRLLFKLVRPILSRMSMRGMAAFKQRVEDDYRGLPDDVGGDAEIDEGSIREAAAAGLRASSSGQPA